MNKSKQGVLSKIANVLSMITKSPIILLSNISRILRFSIKSKINTTYIFLYTTVTVMSIIIVSFGYFYYSIWELYSHDDASLIVGSIEKYGINSKETELKIHEITSYNSFEIIIQDKESNVLITTSDMYEILNNEELMNRNEFYQRFPELSMIRSSLLPIRNYYNDYSITLFYDISRYIEGIIILIFLMSGAYIIGILFMWVVGNLETKKVLKPIMQINQSAKKISGVNLDYRIDVGEAKYELKDLAVTINEMVDRIQDSYTKQQRFVSDVSHELRTPISVITGYANLLDRWGKDSPEVLQESIDALKNEADNMGDLVEKLLFLARNDKDTLKYEMVPFHLSELIEWTLKETQMIDDEHKIFGNIEDGLFLKGDHHSIKQAVRIFIDNAIKYTPNQGRINVRAYRRNKKAIIEIQDWGVGISQKDLSNIFDRFYRADESRTKNTGGHGLGLSIAKIIILQHCGKIRVKSKVGYGSLFTIELPIYEGI